MSCKMIGNEIINKSERNSKYMKKGIVSFVIAYLCVFSIVMIVFSVVPQPQIMGEVDDYSLPVASIIGEGDFSISENDYATYQKLFPEWSDWVKNNRVLSGLTGEHGGEITYYFPTYSIICVPYTLLLHAAHISALRAFPLTNLTVLVIALWFMFKCLKVSEKKRACFLYMLVYCGNPHLLADDYNPYMLV